MSDVHLLANPASGTADEGDRAAVSRQIAAAGHRAIDITGGSPEASRHAVETIVAAGAERLVIVGGDGLVHLALQAVAETPTILGLVPQGTGNDFVRALGLLDLPLDEQVEAALSDAVPIDALKTSHGWVATVATLGFAGDVTARANAMTWPRGGSVYSIATVLQLPRLRRLELTFTVDGVAEATATTMLSIGNTKYFGGGMKICPGAEPVGGIFEATTVGGVGRWTFLRVFPKVFKGTHVDHGSVSVRLGRTGRLEGDAADVWGDGERLGPLPVDFEVVPGAVQIAGARIAGQSP